MNRLLLIFLFIISGDSGSGRVVDYALHNVERELACFVYLCHQPLHQLRLLTRALFIGPYQCSYIFVSCLAFRVYFAGDLNHKISFVVDW